MRDERPTVYTDGTGDDDICVAVELDNLKSIFEIIGSMTDITPENAQKVFHVMSLISPYLTEDEGQPS